MKKIYFILFLVFPLVSQSQLTIYPSQANRGQTLSTTITPPNGTMTVSSGLGSSYEFTLKKGAYEIPHTSYTYPYTGLGFATYATVIFTIPPLAPPGDYDLVMSSTLPWFNPATGFNLFHVNEAKLQGNVFFDANQNGVLDSGEFGIGNQQVRLNQSLLITDFEGNYRSDFHLGNVHDSLIVPPNFTLTSPYTSYLLYIPPDTTRNNFGIYTPPDSLIIHEFSSSAGMIRCARFSNSFWTVSSKSHNVQKGSITIIKDTNLTYSGGTPIPHSVSGDTIRWVYTLQPFQTINAVFMLMGGSPNTYCKFISIDSLFDAGGNFISAEIDTNYTLVRCSFDPNDKNVSPFGIDSMYHYVLNNQELTYTIRFQNCGSDTAYDVDVFDELNSNLNLSTLKLLSSSHPCTWSIDQNRLLKFVFSNIYLPDSTTDEVNSHGMLVFSIRPNSGLPNNTYVLNRASIYFDSNAPVYTNHVYNILVTHFPTVNSSEVNRKETELYPNPVSVNSKLSLAKGKEQLLEIFEITGRQIYSGVVMNELLISAENFSPGIYIYRLSNLDSCEKYTGKLIIGQ
jgi:uncharacterized repeat protein (TIGR01451 family)